MDPLIRKLNSVGKECFISYLPLFLDTTIPVGDVAEQISRERNYTLNACKTRVSKARAIIRDGQLDEALRIVADSEKVDSRARQKALDILKES